MFLMTNEWVPLIFLIGALWVVLWFCLRIFCSPIVAKWSAHGLVMAALFGCFLSMALVHIGIVATEQIIRLMIFGTILSINTMVVPFFYWWDKKSSNSDHAMRIPENVLHSFSFLGGGVGALMSQYIFHHKTQKRKFQLITWCALITNLCFYYIVLFELGI